VALSTARIYENLNSTPVSLLCHDAHGPGSPGKNTSPQLAEGKTNDRG
jgi:hypothetical protein